MSARILTPLLLIATLSAGSAQASNLILNGDFASGTLASWTHYTTAGGTLSASASDPFGAAAFDVDGNGASDLAARFRVGQSGSYTPGMPAGGGIAQSFVSTAGSFSLSMNFASFFEAAPISPASEGGLYQIFLDDLLLGSWNAGSINPGQTARNSVLYAGLISAGSHTLKIEMSRAALSSASFMAPSPRQFIDDVSLSVTATSPVPETRHSTMLLAGLGCIAMLARRRLGRAS